MLRLRSGAACGPAGRDRRRARAGRATRGEAPRHASSASGCGLPGLRDARRRPRAGGGARYAVRAAPACRRHVPQDVPGAVLRAAAGCLVRPVRAALSQGGLMNLLRRAPGRFEDGQGRAVSALRQAEMVASDETGVRIEGANAYHGVFRSPEAVVHHAAPTRAAAVVRDMMDGHRPALWLSDRYAAQQSHGVAHQTCLAHLARDIADAVEASDDPVPWRVQIWLNAAFALAGRVTNLAASTLAAKRRTLDRHLAGILTTASCCDLTRALQGKISRARDQLLTFLDHPGRVEVTNNACERALRPAVVQRKVTNGYRAMWAAEGEAAVRTVVDTARLTPGTPVFGPILTPISA